MRRDFFDILRQAEINRLITRAARRVTGDLGHALSEIPDSHPFKAQMMERYSMWLRIFWDTKSYRDELHRHIDALETRCAEQKKIIEKLGGVDPTVIPF